MVSKKFTRVMSGIMAFLMVFSILPVSVFATETDAKETAETMDVTVTVVTADSEKKAIQGASVSIKDGESFETDESGMATLTTLSVGTTYELTVEHEDYASVTQELTCDAESKAVTIALSALTDVTITVTDATGAVSGAVVSIEGVEASVTTDEDGKAAFEDLTVGTTYTAAVVCEGYVDSSKEFTGGETNVSVVLEKSKHDIVLVVVDGDGNAVSGARVKMADEDKGATDDAGKAVLPSLIHGEAYTVNIECVGFDQQNVEFVCDKDAIDKGVSIDLTRRKLDVVLTVIDKEENPVPGAQVCIADKDYGVTDDAGKVILKEMTYGKSYIADVKCEGYSPESLEFTCKDEITPSVALTKYKVITITGTVTCEEVVVEGADVTLNLAEATEQWAETTKTNAEGKFTFENVYQELVQNITVNGVPYQETILNDVKEDNQIVLERKVFTIKTEPVNADDVAEIKVSASEVKYGDSVEITIQTIAAQSGRSTHSIYQITDNGEIVMEDASGETSCTYKIEDVTKDHIVSVIFSKDREEIKFWVDADGTVYVKDADSEEYTKVDPWRLGNLKVERGTIINEESEEKQGLKVSYDPADNFRVVSVEIDDTTVLQDGKNDCTYAESDFSELSEGTMRKYFIVVQPNQFEVKLAKDVAEEVTSAVVMSPDGIVNYGGDVALSIKPPFEKYLSALTVAKDDVVTDPAVAENVLAKVGYGEHLAYTLPNVREDKIIYAEFSEILENEAGKDAVEVIYSDDVFAEESDNQTVYYLSGDAHIHIQSAVSGVKISPNYCGSFGIGHDIFAEDVMNVLYLLEGNTITKATHTIRTVVDVDAPEITGTESAEIKAANDKITGITWTITAEDNDGGSGINRVVYMKDSAPYDGKDFELDDDAVKALTTIATDNGDGTYSHTFENDEGYYYFWAIDNLGHVSEISGSCYVDSDTSAPEIVSFVANGFRSFTFEDTPRHYPMEEGVTFTVQVTDMLSGIDTAVLKIGDTFTKAMKRTETKDEYVEFAVMVTPEEFNGAVESDENQELEVTVVATDDSINKNISDSYALDKKLIFEEKAPTVSAEIPVSVEVNSVNWYREVETTDVTLVVTIEDTGAGLNNITVTNNNQVTTNYDLQYIAEGETEARYQVLAGKKPVKAILTIQANGEANKITEFDFAFEVTDNEGNKTVYGSEQNGNLKFSVDGVKPVVAKFDLLPNPDDTNSVEYDKKQEADYNGQINANLAKDDAERENTDVEATDYGYFFRRAAKVKVYARDIGSQVQTIGFYAIEKDSELVDGVPQKLYVAEKTVEQDLNAQPDVHWFAEFDVAEGFKGQIYAYAVDNVKNSNQITAVGQDAHPENLTITESWDRHNAYNQEDATRHVVLSLPETTVKDKNGTPLFTLVEHDDAGKAVLNESGIPVTVTVRDAFNGIKEVKYIVKVPGEKDRTYFFNTQNVSVAEYFEDGTKFFVDGTEFNDGEGLTWIVTAMDGNLFTEITADIPVKDDRNGIEVIVTMTDMANNCSSNLSPYSKEKEAEPLKLSIDNDAPVIDVAHLKPSEEPEEKVSTEGDGIASLGKSPYFVGFDPQNLTDGYEIYDKSTLQFKITERNFIKGNLSELSNEEALEQLNELLTLSANKVLINKNLIKDAKEADIYNDLTKELKYFGPFYDNDNGRCNAVYPYVDNNGKYYGDTVYYLVELRNCKEDKISGTYETSIQVKDLLSFSNEETENFIIDETAPAISITFDNKNARNGKYYKADRTATITVVERNFNNESGEIAGTASDDGNAMDFPVLSGWTDSEDYMTHTATVSFTTDGLYQDFAASYVDLAGRNAKVTETEFYVDKTMPVISITGVLDKSANNGTVAPYITYTDTNIDLTSAVITLTGANNGVAEYDAVKEAIEHGEKYVYYDFDHEKEVDDVYTLYVRAVDMAGNTVTETIRFSCNRFGSVFDLSSIADMLGKYNQRERTIVVTETNVDELDLNAVRVTLTKNGNPADLVMGKDFTIEMVGGEGTWHQYTYTLLSNLFKDDGTYSLYFYTEDVAGNINENIDESKEAQISFGIDKTKPIATPIDFESDTQYALETKTVSIEIKDNLLLEGVKIYLNDKEITYVVDGDNYIFDIPMSNTKQTVRIVAVDAAGNEEEIFVKDFLVTTNFFVRWYNNTPLFIGSMVLLALILIVLAWRIIVVILKKRNNDEEEI